MPEGVEGARMNRQEAVERAENDPEIQAVVVTADGWIAVTNEGTAEAAQSLFDKALQDTLTNIQ